jgi:hypothetical protein
METLTLCGVEPFESFENPFLVGADAMREVCKEHVRLLDTIVQAGHWAMIGTLSLY